MSTPESTPTHLSWATLCQSRLYPPVGSLHLASGGWDGIYDMSTKAVFNFFLFKLKSKLINLLKVVTNEK
jgi:hypothetical protein